MTTPSPREPWNDDRLGAAFAARAALTRTPAGLVEATRAAMDAQPDRTPLWRRFLVPAAVIVVTVGALGGGIALLDSRGGIGMFRDGPSPDLKTFAGGEFTFDYPADWLGYGAGGLGSGGGGQPIAVLGTQPVDPRCGDHSHVDINCVYEERLEPGGIRVFVGTGAYRGGTLFDRADIENGTSSRLAIDGMPAILDEFDPRPDSYYREDALVHWSIARPGTDGTNVIRIEAMLREPSVDAGRANLEALIASFRFGADVAPKPTETTLPSEAAGLPVVTVAEAIAIRDAGTDDRELAVRGWYAPFYPSRACGLPLGEAPRFPLQMRCPDDLLPLMQDREQLTTVTEAGMSFRGPTGPTISPDYDNIDMAWSTPIDDPARIVELVVIGHFDDSSAARCPAAEQVACADRFVVDRIDSIDGVEQPLSVLHRADGTELSTPDDVRAAVEREAPDRPMLSMAVFNAAEVEGLPDGPSATVWVARVLGLRMLEHHIVFDGTEEVFEVRTSGPPKFPVERADPEPTPSPAPAWGAWPPQDAFSVLEFKDHTGRKAFVAVVDDSGLLEWVREGVPDPSIGSGAAEGLFRDPSGAHRYRLRWRTGICDRETTLSIAPDVTRILIEPAPRDGCDAIGLQRELVLEFSRDVDPAEVDLEVIPATLLPEQPPETTTMVVELQRAGSIENVVVIDHAGSLMEARAATDVPAISELIGVQIVRADDGGTIVLWDGSLCDRDLWLSIEAGDLGPPDRIVVHGTRSEPCRSALIRRAIWLDLGPVDVGSIDGQSSIAATSEGQVDAGPGISVAGALVIQSLSGDDRTLQVRGWYWRDPTIYDCFVPPSPPPVLEPGCHGPNDRLLLDPAYPTGPGFSVWLRPGATTPAIPPGDPREVVVLGHFDDVLAEDCLAATLGACRDVFVVEEVLSTPTP